MKRKNAKTKRYSTSPSMGRAGDSPPLKAAASDSAGGSGVVTRRFTRAMRGSRLAEKP